MCHYFYLLLMSLMVWLPVQAAITQDMISSNNINAISAEIYKDHEAVNKPLIIETNPGARGDWRHTKTPLYGAVEQNNVTLVRLLLNNGANVEQGYYKGDVWNNISESPLYKAVVNNNFESVKALTETHPSSVNLGRVDYSMRECGDDYCFTTVTTTPLDVAQESKKNVLKRETAQKIETYLRTLNAKNGGTLKQ